MLFTYCLYISVLHALVVEDSISSVTSLLTADGYMNLHTSMCLMYLVSLWRHRLLVMNHLLLLVYDCSL